MINKILKIVFLSIILLFFVNNAQATHIVGGDLTYRCLGDGQFEVTLTLRRDCQHGADDAEFDEEAIIAVFTQYGPVKSVGIRGGFSIPFTGSDTLRESLDIECGYVANPPVCYHEAVYIDTIYLPQPLPGRVYKLVYQRCCRNVTLKNVKNPLVTGTTHMVEIDEFAYNQCNTSPVFKRWAPVYICGNKPINFDHSANESDGDSLVYKLFTPFAGASILDPKPDMGDPASYTQPFRDVINWEITYGLDNVFGTSTDQLKIDPVTGIITGTPTKLGQYLVGVMVEEYRNGQLISEVRRDFEYNVITCLPPPLAIIESVDAICGSGVTDTLFLYNNSLNGDSYTWTVYSHSTGITVTSIEEDFEYIYTLPASGKDTFDINLDAYNVVAGCSHDTSKTIIVVEDPLIADFDVIIDDCYVDSLDITLSLEDKFDLLNPKYTWKSSKWTLIFDNGDILYAEGKIVSLIVPKEKKATVLLVIDTEEKCQASIEKIIELDFPIIEFILNPIVICIGDSAKLIKNPNKEWTYTWVPETGLDFGPDINDKSDPTFKGDKDTKYIVTVTDGICTDIDSIQVIVNDYFDISIQGPDTVCTDSIELIAIGAEPGDTVIVFEWSDNIDFSPIIAEGETVTLKLNDKVNMFFLRVKEGTGCSNNIDSITVYNGTLNLEYPDLFEYCTNTNSWINVLNQDPTTIVTIHWEDNPLIVRGQDSLSVLIFADEVGEYDLIFHAVSDFGCELTDTIHVIANEGPELEITNTITCGTYTMCFGVSVVDGSSWDLNPYFWDFGDPDNPNDTSSLANPCYDYGKPGTYHVTLSVGIAECGGTAFIEKDVVVPEIIDINNECCDSCKIYCAGDEDTIWVTKNVPDAIIEWFNSKTDTLMGVGDTLIFYPSGEMTIYAIGTDQYGCSDTAFFSLCEYEFNLTYIDPGVQCYGDTVELEIIDNIGANLSYEWIGDNIISGGNTNNPTVIVYESSDFEVYIVDLDYGCDSTFVVSVEVSDIDIYIEADTLAVVITNGTDITVYNVPPGSTIEWSTGETNVETITYNATVENVGFVTVCATVTDQYGCVDEDCVDIEVIDPPCDETDIYIPNAFSPNNDGNNDVFRVRGRYLRTVDIEIYDRWGELVLRKENGNEFENWDGTFRGKNLIPDVYTFRIHVQCEDTDHYEKIGNVSIIK